MKRFVAFMLVMVMTVMCLPSVFAEEERTWHVGFGMAEFVPEDYDPETDSFEKTYYLAGYNKDSVVEGILDPQCARAAYISDGETAIIVVAIDCVGLSSQSIENIRTRIQPLVEEYGIADVHIAATHTHAGIETLGIWGPGLVDGKDDAFMEVLYDAAAAAVEDACASVKTGKLYFGSAFTGSLQRDSRDPQIYDKNIYRIRFEPSDGSAGLQIISYDAHPEALRSDNRMVSADYPCYMGRKIQEKTGDNWMFFAGAVGGLIMTHRLKDTNGREYPVEENVVLTGEQLADTLLKNTTERELEPCIDHATKPVTLDVDNSTFLAMTYLGVLDFTPVESDGRYGLAMETRVSMMRLGGEDGMSIVMVPGELFPELAHGGSFAYQVNDGAENPTPMKDVIDGDFIVWGLVDDEIGYIVPPEDFLLNETAPYIEYAYDKFDRRHYEETNSVGPETAGVINGAVEELAEEIQAK